MPRNEAIDLLFSAGIEDFSRLPKKETITGREVFSMVLPSDFEFKGESRDKQKVIIEDGLLKEGFMDKANLGEGQGLMLRNIHKKYGQETAIGILGKLFRLGTKTLVKIGFTTGISDTDLPVDAKKRIQEILDEAYKNVDELIKNFYDEALETFPGKTMLETLELRVLERLNLARNETGKIVAEYTRVQGGKVLNQSGTLVMSDSGARGSPLNLAQMSACVGQQALRGARIIKGYKGRTLSCFKKEDLRPDAHGFIKGGFKSGLNPHEFFFMAMTGRDSLMDTALRTPKSGYLYRRLANALQDVKVEYDYTVREASGKIIQFRYGGDGIDVSKSEGGKINVDNIIANS